MEECFLTSDKIQDKRELCKLACQETNQSHTCKPTSEISIMNVKQAIDLRPGAPCDNFKVNNRKFT